MLDKIVQTSLKNRLLILVFTAGVVGFGYWSYQTIPVDSYPDRTPTMVRIFTVAQGLSPVDVEKQISYPIEISMYGLPQLDRVTSTSVFGLSQVNVYFKDGTDYFFGRRLVTERLSQARQQIPEGVGQPRLGPMSTGLGRIHMYEVVNEGEADHSLTERRSAQDWIVKPMLRTTPGVTGVLSVGGHIRQYQVHLDHQKMLARDIAIEDVRRALGANNKNVGASYVERAGEEFIVRGYGWVSPGPEGLKDIRSIPVAQHGGTPIRIQDVGEVRFGPAIRRGTLTHDGQETVGGFTLKLINTNSQEVLDRVEEKLGAIRDALPDGMGIETFYSQGDLIEKAIGTIENALLQGAILVLLCLYLFLGNIRSTLIIVAALPFSSLVAFIAMKQLGMSANLMSLGGLAIGIGIMVDGAVVVLENVFRHLEEGADSKDMGSLVYQATREVARPVIFSMTIIVVVFLPLFTLQGVEGKTFRPMASSITFALIGAALMALTIVPVLCVYLFSKDAGQTEPALVRWLRGRFRPIVSWSVGHPRVLFGVASIALVGSLSLVPFLGTEFVPTLREGTLQIRSVLPPGGNLKSSIEYSHRISDLLDEFSEVEGTHARVGRAEVGGGPAPVNVVASIVDLKPLDEWESGRSYSELQAAIGRRLDAEIPGMKNNVSQPIQIRTNELLSGVRAELAINIFGEDLDELSRIGEDVAEVARGVDGTVDVRVQQQGGKNQIVIRPKRQKLSRLGVSIEKLLDSAATAIGGSKVGHVYEGVKRYSIFTRLKEDQRDHLADLKKMPVLSVDGHMVKLGEVADLEVYRGPKKISRNKASRRLFVQLNVRDRDMGSVVSELQRKIPERVSMPAGYFVEYGGQFKNQRRAMQRLYIVVPVTLALIFLMLFMAFGSLRHAAMIFMNVPFATIGGIVALWLSGEYLSVPAAVGFIAVFGVAVLNGNVLVAYINQLRQKGTELTEAVVIGAEHRLRPVLMTALTTIGGLSPLLWADDIGSNVQRPLAAVVVGGLVTSTLLTLVVLPAIYRWVEETFGSASSNQS
jgi:cobalt-zinc-cadmium resistance protein CzcA